MFPRGSSWRSWILLPSLGVRRRRQRSRRRRRSCLIYHERERCSIGETTMLNAPHIPNKSEHSSSQQSLYIALTQSSGNASNHTVLKHRDPSISFQTIRLISLSHSHPFLHDNQHPPTRPPNRAAYLPPYPPPPPPP